MVSTSILLSRVRRSRGATDVATPLARDAHHPVLGTLRAELRRFGALLAVRRSLGATGVATPLVRDVHHPVLDMLGAKLRRFGALLAVIRPLGATVVAAPLALDTHRRVIVGMFYRGKTRACCTSFAETRPRALSVTTLKYPPSTPLFLAEASPLRAREPGWGGQCAVVQKTCKHAANKPVCLSSAEPINTIIRHLSAEGSHENKSGNKEIKMETALLQTSTNVDPCTTLFSSSYSQQ